MFDPSRLGIAKGLTLPIVECIVGEKRIDRILRSFGHWVQLQTVKRD
jgi:hypothetical protein